MSDLSTTNKPGRNNRRWWRIYAHKIQKHWAGLIVVILLVYPLLILFLTTVSSDFSSDSGFVANTSLSDRALHSIKFLMFGHAAWPTIVFVVIPMVVIASIYLTHRIGGPLHHLEKFGKELRQGNLSTRIRLRKGDEFHELADEINEAVANLERALVEIRDREGKVRQAIHRYLHEMKSHPTMNFGLLEDVEVAIKEGEQIEGVLKQFRLSDSPSSPQGGYSK